MTAGGTFHTPSMITASGGLDMIVIGRPVALAAQPNGDLVLIVESPAPCAAPTWRVIVTSGAEIPDGMRCVDAAPYRGGAMLLYVGPSS